MQGFLEGHRSNSRKISSFKDQLDRLINATIVFASEKVSENNSTKNSIFTYKFEKKTKKKLKEAKHKTAELLYLVNKIEESIFWDKNDQKIHKFTLRITDEFYNMIMSSKSIIFDYNVIPKLKSSPVALDLAIYLSYWSFNATYIALKDLEISYEELFLQFGGQSQKKEFKRLILKALNKVLKVMPYMKVLIQDDKLVVIKGSLPSVSATKNAIESMQNKTLAGELERECKNLVQSNNENNVEYLADSIPNFNKTES